MPRNGQPSNMFDAREGGRDARSSNQPLLTDCVGVHACVCVCVFQILLDVSCMCSHFFVVNVMDHVLVCARRFW